MYMSVAKPHGLKLPMIYHSKSNSISVITRRLNGTKTVGYVSLHILTHYFSPLSAALN
jgi:hypothetical protein